MNKFDVDPALYGRANSHQVYSHFLKSPALLGAALCQRRRKVEQGPADKPDSSHLLFFKTNLQIQMPRHGPGSGITPDEVPGHLCTVFCFLTAQPFPRFPVGAGIFH